MMFISPTTIAQQSRATKGTVPLMLILLALLLFIPGTSATQSYKLTGGNQQNYDLSDTPGIFNAQLQSYTTYQQLMSSPRFVPLVSRNLNDNNDTTIVVWDKPYIKTFGDLLIPKDLIAVGNYEASPPILFDIDNDGNEEIIIIPMGSASILMYALNNSDKLRLKYNVSAPGISGGAYDMVVFNCGQAHECMAYNAVHGGSLDTLSAFQFNETGISSISTLISFSSASSFVCFPAVPMVSVTDFNNDGLTDYITTFTRNDVSADDEKIHLYNVNYNSGSITNNMAQTITVRTPFISGVDCTAQVQNSFSSAIITNLDNYASTKEAIFAYQTQAALGIIPLGYIGLGMKAYNLQPFGIIGTYPAGALIAELPAPLGVSNVFTGNVFNGNTIAPSFCSNALDANQFGAECINIPLQGQTEFLFQNNASFSGVGNFPFNQTGTVPALTQIFPSLTHMVNMDTTSGFEGGDPDEFLTPYGIFRISGSTLQQVFGNTNEYGNLIAIDLQKNGKADLLHLSIDSGLRMYDDTYQNTPPSVWRWELNPCGDVQPIKTNVTASLSVQCNDIDGDKVASSITVYKDEPYEFNISSNTFVNSRINIPFSFKVNQTTSASTLRIYCWDNFLPNVTESRDIIFAVSDIGVNYGACKSIFDQATNTSLGNASDTIEAGTGAGTSKKQNVITKTLTSLNDQFGWGLGLGILWLVVMVIVAIAIWFSRAGHEHPKLAFGLFVFVEFMMLIIGTILDFISPGVIITIVVLGIVVIGLFAGKMFTGAGN